MSRFEMKDNDRHIVAEDPEVRASELAQVVADAWERTTSGPIPSAPAYGFTTDRRWSAEVSPLGHGSNGRGRSAPVTAEEDT